ncbi:enoyl-CoA hydratase-related protein [Pelomicrobium sp. G1]|uniref:enoyl-CoA hydratase-related protein n=1 Tax=unclassified Pelomicrobium TaxID=2815318 RepID=UPI000B2B41AE|nr:MAG: crotonase [Burkholderiales bacterium]
MAYENLILEQVEHGIYRLTLNRPKALNALNPETLAELGAAVGEVAADPAARALLVTGAGDKAFVAGADISRMVDMNPEEGQRFCEAALQAFRAIERLPIPAIALVNGYALGGGCELAMACDFIVASENAVFGQPEVNLGINPGFGGTQRLPRRVGTGLALELLLTGRQVKAEEAKQIGLVNHVVPKDKLQAFGLELARQIAAKAPLAVRYTKHLVHRGKDLDLDNACALETQAFGLLCATEDKREGMRAFLEKRPAVFRGR